MDLAVGDVGFFDDERVDPIAGLLFSFEALNELQEAILKFEGNLVEGFKIGFAYLLSVTIGVKSRNGFAQGSQGKVQKLQILPKRTATVAFGDVAMDRIGGSDGLRTDSSEFELKALEDPAIQHVEINRVPPNRNC